MVGKKSAVADSAFESMRKNRTSELSKLTTKVEELNSSGPAADPRYWQPTVDKAGNGYAIIRFLPAPEGEEVPFVRLFNHAFKSAGGWYIENSLTTLGQNDPVSESNRELWATNTEENQKIVRQRKRKLNFISNIQVVKDASNPEAEGKVFFYKYGKKIWDKIADAMSGIPEESVAGYNPFDLWEGANFKLRIRTVEGFRNYDKSEFDKQSAISEDDSEIEKIWKQAILLQPEIAADKFKTYEELETRFQKAIGNARRPSGPETPAPTGKTAPAKSTPKAEEEFGEEGGEDADLARFRELARDD